MGKNREQKKLNEKKRKGNIYNIYNKKHIRINLEKKSKLKNK